jgi:hypothetical protein
MVPPALANQQPTPSTTERKARRPKELVENVPDEMPEKKSREKLMVTSGIIFVLQPVC